LLSPGCSIPRFNHKNVRFVAAIWDLGKSGNKIELFRFKFVSEFRLPGCLEFSHVNPRVVSTTCFFIYSKLKHCTIDYFGWLHHSSQSTYFTNGIRCSSILMNGKGVGKKCGRFFRRGQAVAVPWGEARK
jgi:hypothetical protein